MKDQLRSLTELVAGHGESDSFADARFRSVGAPADRSEIRPGFGIPAMSGGTGGCARPLEVADDHAGGKQGVPLVAVGALPLVGGY